MRRILLATVTILVTITLLPSPTVQTQQPEKDQFPKPHNPEKDEFPKPETYPQAGANCKDKRKLEPWLGTPNVSPGKSQCVLSVYNCQTDETDVYRSGPRDSGTVSLDCSDYERAMEALVNREICCCKEQKTPPWFDREQECDGPWVPPVVLDIPIPSMGGVTCRLSYWACDSLLWEKRDQFFSTGLFSGRMTMDEATTFCKSKGFGADSVPHRLICCVKWRQAIKDWYAFRRKYPPEPRDEGVPPGRVQPCNPFLDADCDGMGNRVDPTPIGDCPTYPAAPSPSPSPSP